MDFVRGSIVSPFVPCFNDVGARLQQRHLAGIPGTRTLTVRFWRPTGSTSAVSRVDRHRHIASSRWVHRDFRARRPIPTDMMCTNMPHYRRCVGTRSSSRNDDACPLRLIRLRSVRVHRSEDRSDDNQSISLVPPAGIEPALRTWSTRPIGASRVYVLLSGARQPWREIHGSSDRQQATERGRVKTPKRKLDTCIHSP